MMPITIFLNVHKLFARDFRMVFSYLKAKFYSAKESHEVGSLFKNTLIDASIFIEKRSHIMKPISKHLEEEKAYSRRIIHAD